MAFALPHPSCSCRRCQATTSRFGIICLPTFLLTEPWVDVQSKLALCHFLFMKMSHLAKRRTSATERPALGNGDNMDSYRTSRGLRRPPDLQHFKVPTPLAIEPILNVWGHLAEEDRTTRVLGVARSRWRPPARGLAWPSLQTALGGLREGPRSRSSSGSCPSGIP
jgi:hypothetical protein